MRAPFSGDVHDRFFGEYLACCAKHARMMSAIPDARGAEMVSHRLVA